jgi:hypothetical protein
VHEREETRGAGRDGAPVRCRATHSLSLLCSGNPTHTPIRHPGFAKCRQSHTRLQEECGKVTLGEQMTRLAAAGGPTAAMRAAVVDLAARIVDKLGLSPEVLHTAVCTMDRYLAVQASFVPARLPLLGVTCLKLAGMMQLEFWPAGHELVRLSGGPAAGFTAADVSSCQLDVMRALDYRFSSYPTPFDFLAHHLSRVGATPQLANVAAYVATLAIQEEGLSYLPASMLSAAALLVAVQVECGDAAAHNIARSGVLQCAEAAAAGSSRVGSLTLRSIRAQLRALASTPAAAAPAGVEGTAYLDGVRHMFAHKAYASVALAAVWGTGVVSTPALAYTSGAAGGSASEPRLTRSTQTVL